MTALPESHRLLLSIIREEILLGNTGDAHFTVLPSITICGMQAGIPESGFQEVFESLVGAELIERAGPDGVDLTTDGRTEGRLGVLAVRVLYRVAELTRAELKGWVDLIEVLQELISDGHMETRDSSAARFLAATAEWSVLGSGDPPPQMPKLDSAASLGQVGAAARSLRLAVRELRSEELMLMRSDWSGEPAAPDLDGVWVRLSEGGQALVAGPQESGVVR